MCRLLLRFVNAKKTRKKCANAVAKAAKSIQYRLGGPASELKYITKIYASAIVSRRFIW